MQQRAAAAEAEVLRLSGEMAGNEGELAQANDQVALLNLQINALREQLAALQEALDASEARDKDQQAVIADLGRRLNAALAQKVQELERFRSEFFGRLREVLGDRKDIQIVGDRFVFQSEVLFESGSAQINEAGLVELSKLAQALREIAATIPTDLEWILRVDGHSDRRPINTPEFPRTCISGGARHRGRERAHRGRRSRRQPRRRRLRRSAPDRPRRHGRGLSPQSPHRVQADRTLTAPQRLTGQITSFGSNTFEMTSVPSLTAPVLDPESSSPRLR